jgi:hypothetical protein
MKKIIVFLTCLFSLPVISTAQTPLQKEAAIPNGAVVYALPATVIEIRATAVHERFTAGPYARYAQKYLGLEAPVTDSETCFLKSIALQSLLEADASHMYALEIKDKKAAANFLHFSASGLIVSLDWQEPSPLHFRFATAPSGHFPDRGTETNLEKDRVTLYKTVKTEEGFEKVPVQQNQLVEKNPERQAEAAANFIFNLRKKRVDMITGELEWALSGDGLQAALKEIARLEEEYLSLFLGKTTSDTQSAVFYVTPTASQPKQLYVAFRFSDTQGLLPASNVAGRPISLELVSEKSAAPLPAQAPDKGDKKAPRLTYRLPEAVQVHINDGHNNLLQTRLVVYQLGTLVQFPLHLQVK